MDLLRNHATIHQNELKKKNQNKTSIRGDDNYLVHKQVSYEAYVRKLAGNQSNN